MRINVKLGFQTVINQLSDRVGQDFWVTAELLIYSNLKTPSWNNPLTVARWLSPLDIENKMVISEAVQLLDGLFRIVGVDIVHKSKTLKQQKTCW